MKKPVLLFVIILALFSGCSEKSSRYLVSLSGSTMGTTYSVKVVSLDKPNENKSDYLKAKIDSVLVEVNRQMSTYIPTSEISLFNASASSDWMNISPDFAFVAENTKRMGELSGGALDLTIGPLVNLWGFGPNFKPHSIPSEYEIQEAKSNSGLDKINVSLNPPRISKSLPGVYIDLSSTAKGFGVDKVAEFVKSLGFNEFLVEIGGEVNVR